MSYLIFDFQHEYIQQMSDTIPDELEDMNWAVLETEVQQYFKKTPHFSTLSGNYLMLSKAVKEKRIKLMGNSFTNRTPILNSEFRFA